MWSAARGPRGGEGRTTELLSQKPSIWIPNCKVVWAFLHVTHQGPWLRAPVPAQHAFSVVEESSAMPIQIHLGRSQPQEEKWGLSGLYEAFKEQVLCSSIWERNLRQKGSFAKQLCACFSCWKSHLVWGRLGNEEDLCGNLQQSIPTISFSNASQKGPAFKQHGRLVWLRWQHSFQFLLQKENKQTHNNKCL